MLNYQHSDAEISTYKTLDLRRWTLELTGEDGHYAPPIGQRLVLQRPASSARRPQSIAFRVAGLDYRDTVDTADTVPQRVRVRLAMDR